MSDLTTMDCGSGGGADTFFGLRVGSIFVILVGSMFGALFPVIAARYSKIFKIPKAAFEFAKWFGSGVIIATAFIHLLAPATMELTDVCLADGWQGYPYALALCLLSIFGIFLVELVAFRWGTAKLAKIGLMPMDMNRFSLCTWSRANMASNNGSDGNDEKILEEARPLPSTAALDSPETQIVGVAILEFGVLLHSVLVGLTLAVDPGFKVLFVVLVFHQTFEGLGVGSRLAYMQPHLPHKYRNVAVWGGLLYGITTPLGLLQAWVSAPHTTLGVPQLR
ncbi:Zinc/iron permease [Rhodocollybia butyracea]|uniref:Zinc/iron permease n=1 Tax=Rhodocollybia butyracea TaxID=206335 RepID=A0A9P5PV64_9AGAR|nr:Zinc/iron permease [Rhodocollybia butyracea]